MPLLPPRIGKVHEHARHTARGEARQRKPDIFGEHAAALGQAELPQALIDQARPLQSNLETHDLISGPWASARTESRPSGTNLELQLRRQALGRR
jgi:hypothetical protein